MERAGARVMPCFSDEDCLSYLQAAGAGTEDGVVQAHIDECAQCRVLLAEAARALLAPEAPALAGRTLTAGEVLCGRYEIRRFMARGGMGEVYEAFDRVLGEPVALKTLALASVDRADAAERFLAEVRLARKVTHPNVCRILELGVHRKDEAVPETIPFFTMELLTGETLAARLVRAGRLDPAEALRILRDITAGLAAVHEAGIVHRDFKSENVFLVTTDGSERALVMDFGLALVLSPAPGGGSSHRMLVGSVDYMAPEQVEGRRPARAWDIYALGVVAFEMITGRLPFSGDTPMATATSRIHKDAPRPSQFRPELARVWDDVIGRCLAKDPAARFSRIGDPLDALRGRPRSGSVRTRTAFGVGAAVAIALAAASALVAASVRPQRVSRVAQIAHKEVTAKAPPSAVAPIAPLTGPPGPAPERASPPPQTAPTISAMIRDPPASGGAPAAPPPRRLRAKVRSPATVDPRRAVTVAPPGDDDLINPFGAR